MARTHELEDLGVVERNRIRVDIDTVVGLDVGLGLGDNGKGTKTQEVHLEQAHVGDRMAFVLGDLDAALGIELRGHVLVYRVAADEDGAGVHALAAGEALDGQRRVDDAARILVIFVGIGKIGVVELLLARLLLEHLAQLGGRIARDHLGQALAHVHRVIEHAGGVVDGLFGLDGRVGNDVGDLLGTVELAHVLHDLEATLIVEVHIDIGHLGTLRGQEPLEHQTVLQRVERGDVHGIGDDSACGRATAGADADAVFLGPFDVLGNDEEVRGKTLVADDLVFVLKALLDGHAVDGARLPVVAVILAQALLALAAELALMRLARIEQREARQDDGIPVELDIALLGDLERIVDGLLAIREECAHLFLGLHVELGARHADAVGVVDLGARTDAHHHVLDGSILAREVMEVVGGDDLHADLLGNLDEVMRQLLVGHAVVGGDAVLLDLDVEIAGIEEVAQGRCPRHGAGHVTAVDAARNDARDTGGAADKTLGMAAQVVERHAWLVVKALHSGLGDRLHQVDVALLVLGEQDHVVELGFAVARKGVVGSEVDLAAKDGLDDGRGFELVDIALLIPQLHILVVLLPALRVLLAVGLFQLVATALLQEGLVVTPHLVVGRVMVHRIAGERQLGNAVHIAVVGNGDGGHAQVDGALHHV